MEEEEGDEEHGKDWIIVEEVEGLGVGVKCFFSSEYF